jgi:hypothetical protein
VMEYCIRWPGLHNPPTNQIEIVWDESDRKVERKRSQEVLSICENS